MSDTAGAKFLINKRNRFTSRGGRESLRGHVDDSSRYQGRGVPIHLFHTRQSMRGGMNLSGGLLWKHSFDNNCEFLRTFIKDTDHWYSTGSVGISNADPNQRIQYRGIQLSYVHDTRFYNGIRWQRRCIGNVDVLYHSLQVGDDSSLANRCSLTRVYKYCWYRGNKIKR